MGSYGVVAARRRGFVRLALETGAELVPVIGVGEPMYSNDTADNPPGNFISKRSRFLVKWVCACTRGRLCLWHLCVCV